MSKELIYIWIYKDKNNCFNKQGFNFSPEYFVDFNYDNKNISIKRTDNINVYSEHNIVNVSAIIGENGTGKTTLLYFLNGLMSCPLYNNKNETYKKYNDNEIDFDKYLAVYIHNEEYKIINCIGEDIICEKRIIKTFNSEMYKNDNFIGNITHIYITNGEYGDDYNLYHNGIDHITIKNSTMTYLAETFYRKTVNISLENTKFNKLQSDIIKKLNNQNFQSILDVLFYGDLFINKKNNFLGKKISTIDFNFSLVTNRLFSQKNLYSDVINEFKEKIQRIDFEEFNPIRSSLIFNLAFELYYIYDNFALSFSENKSLDDLDNYCRDFINKNIGNNNEKRYYNNAIKEIINIISITEKGDIKDNLLPKNDLAYNVYCNVDVKSLYTMFIQISKSEISFITKYINILNTGMSSGERVILNFMSRIYLINFFEHLINSKVVKIKDDVLILIDEVDLYLHPDWQRRLIDSLLNEISYIFKDKRIQIILASHSPIVLSDIPRENIIYLKKVKDKVIIQNREYFSQTFGANIYLLYKDAFFIKDGIGIGEYSKKYINELFLSIQRNDYKDDINKKIELIGEPIVKNKLLKMISKKQEESFRIKCDEKKELLRFLKRQKVEIENQIAFLEGNNYD